MENTECLYLQDTYLGVMEAVCQHVDFDEKGAFVIFDRIVFYPQGGGQPADTGELNAGGCKARVTDVHYEAGEVRHYVSADDNLPAVGDNVAMPIDRFVSVEKALEASPKKLPNISPPPAPKSPEKERIASSLSLPKYVWKLLKQQAYTDELVEVTPKTIRLRKRILDPNMRKRMEKTAEG